MDQIEFARRLLRRYDEAILALDRGIVSGHAESFEAYRHACGKRAGLEAARAIVVDQLGESGREDLQRGA